MSRTKINSWQDVHAEVLHRIHKGLWKPGEMIPFEADLAAELGCARTTVNRALRALAEEGLLNRRRKAGTRVAAFPVRKATLSIPIIRQEIEELGQSFSYRLLSQKTAVPPAAVRSVLKTGPGRKALHVRALYQAGDAPYVCEDRWVSLDAVPSVRDVDLTRQNLNEWLVAYAPLTNGGIAFGADVPDTAVAQSIGSAPGEAVLCLERTTWNEKLVITFLRLFYPPGHRLRTSI